MRTLTWELAETRSRFEDVERKLVDVVPEFPTSLDHTSRDILHAQPLGWPVRLTPQEWC